jgi:hypothetical protein
VRPSRGLERWLGGALLVLSLFPVYRVLDTGGDAPFRDASVSMAEATLEHAWWGSLLVILLATVLAVLFPQGASRFGRRLGELLRRPGLPLFAASIGVLAFLLALGVERLAYQSLFTNMDEIASAVHARYVAVGSLAGPPLPIPEAWLVPNTLMVQEGWVSQYPPAHLAVMALFFRLGIPTLVGPVLMGLMAWLLALSFPRLLPDQEGAARAGALLTAMSPFLLFLAGGAWSHLTAGAALALVLYASLRARDGSAWWGLAVGCGVGIMVSARPLVGLVLGTALPLTLWGPSLLAGRIPWTARRGLGTVAGGLPFAVLLGLFNHRLFGGITRFGYLEAYGDSHRLGFHPDPWGYMYGPGSALAFTSTDFLALGVQLLETPLPLTVAVGALLLLGPRLPKGSGTILAWALLPLLANAFYWFHQPRLLFEAAPAWILLAALLVARGVSMSGSPVGALWPPRLRQVTAWAAVVSLLAAAGWGVPTRWASYSWTAETLDRIQVPPLPTEDPSVVFVHASWDERLSARLQGAGGMRQDSLVSVLRRNTNCEIHAYAEAREARERLGQRDAPLPEIDLLQTPESPQGLRRLSVAPGVWIRTREGEAWTPECIGEAQADRFGTVALAPLLWQGDLPGLERGEPLFVRDLGPLTNRKVKALYPDREAFVFGYFSQGGVPQVLPYDQGMRILWGEVP